MSGSDSSAAGPVIGLTIYRQQVKSGVWDVPGAFLPGVYIEGVTRAGGIATLLPPQAVDVDIAERVVAGLDGLILTGGKDIDPAVYGHQPHHETEEPARDRDQWELALLRAALGRNLPVLGICRGVQVINVAFGGTLHQHLPDVVGHGDHRIGNAVFATTDVDVVGGSRLGALLGDRLQAKCYHHQAIDRLGEGLVASAASDGVIEAVESPGHRFLLGVQWHPEEALDDLRLFTGLVDAARTFSTSKVNP